MYRAMQRYCFQITSRFWCDFFVSAILQNFARRLYYNKQNGQRFYCRMPRHTFC